MAKILVDGKIKELIIVDENGVEWSNDLIGGFSDVKHLEEEEAQWEMSQDQFEWFEELIEMIDSQKDLEEEYRHKIGNLPQEYYDIPMCEETYDGVEKSLAWLKAELANGGNKNV